MPYGNPGVISQGSAEIPEAALEEVRKESGKTFLDESRKKFLEKYRKELL